MSNTPVVLITGATSGIGRGAAIEFARRKYRLMLTGRKADAMKEVVAECERAGAAKVCTTLGDITKKETAEAIVRNTIDAFGALNVLVNNAGVLLPTNMENGTINDYDTTMDVNVRSVVQLTQMALPHIIESKGNICNVSSIASFNPNAKQTFYGMSKAAIDQLTRNLALELAPKGVRVNAVNPGVIITDIHKRAGMSDSEYKEYIEHSNKTHALGRVGNAEEVAKAIAFLASDDASFTTGQFLICDGGRHLMSP